MAENVTLMHHGVRGQKWGVRRFQNADGSLTAKGKKRQKQILKSSSEQRIAKKIAVKKLSKSLKRTSIENHDVMQKRLNSIKNGTLKAGRDYIVTNKNVHIIYPKWKFTRIGIGHKRLTYGHEVIMLK